MYLSGLVSVTFRELSVRQIIDLVSSTGIESIEWGGDVHVPAGDLTGAAEVRKWCDECRILISAYGSYYRAGTGQPSSFENVLNTAVALGAQTIRVWAGDMGSAQTSASQRKQIVQDLIYCCDLAARKGITVATEFHANTLTDDSVSCLSLMNEINRANIRTFWQPPNGMPTADAVVGLELIKPFLSNLHVLHWWPDVNHRHPLIDGKDRWWHYLQSAACNQPRFVSLEFMKGDSVLQFQEDAVTLLQWLQELKH